MLSVPLFSCRFFVDFQNVLYFCHQSYFLLNAEWLRQGLETYTLKAYLYVLVLTCWNFATSQLSVKNKAAGTPFGVYIHCTRIFLISVCYGICSGVLVIYIIVGFSALLVSTDRVMRRPQHVKRVTDWLHVFLYMYVLSNLTSVHRGSQVKFN